MREILISLGVLLVCCVLLVVSQVTANRSRAVAVELTPPPVVVATPAQTPAPEPMEDKQADSITTDSGLKYIDLVVGTGASPEIGKKVKVHYTGTLEDNRKFDSSRDRDQPFSFTIGVGQVIKGWDEGVASMKVGGRRKLIIPPELGYGTRGIGPIPPNSTLIFDVELLGVG